MKREQIRKKIDKFSFPVFPQMLMQVKKVTADEYSSAQDLAETILKDQSLTTKMLSIANSAYYGFYGNISTVTQAIVVLGFDSVKNITFGLMAYNTLSKLIDESLIRRFWEHSLATGVCAELLAEKIGYQPTEEALVAGLIHDVGKLMLAQLYPDEFAEVELVMHEHKLYSHVAEASILGITHGEVGRMMAEKWGLPANLVAAITNHHQKDWGESQLTDIISFSDFMIQVLPNSSDREKIDRLVNMGSSILNLKKESINAVMQVLVERLEEYCRIFEIPVENLTDYAAAEEEEPVRPKKTPQTLELSQKDSSVAILSEISKAMVTGRPQAEILQMVLEGVLRLEQAASAILFLADKSREHITGRMGLGKNAMGLCSACSVSVDAPGSVLARVFRSGSPQFLAAPLAGRCGTSIEREIFAELEVESACILPITGKSDIVGMLFVAWDYPQPQREEAELETMHLFARQATLALAAPQEAAPDEEPARRRRSSLQLDLD